MRDSYGIGQQVEQEAARLLSCYGIVIPVSQYQHNTGGLIAAPMLVTLDELIISPDLLVIAKNPFWVEVKGKTAPAYFFKNHQWRHGIDAQNAQQYLMVQENSYPVFILIHEERSPRTPELLLRHPCAGDPDDDLYDSGLWLGISLTAAFRCGVVQPNNPAMIKESNPTGLGLYWPRAAMTVWFTPDRRPGQLEDLTENVGNR